MLQVVAVMVEQDYKILLQELLLGMLMEEEEIAEHVFLLELMDREQIKVLEVVLAVQVVLVIVEL